MPDREKVINGLTEIVNFFDIMSAIEGRCNELKQDAENAIAFLKEQEAIIRCKDCKKHGDIACPLWTDAVEWETDDDWFCADAWKRDSYDDTWQAT